MQYYRCKCGLAESWTTMGVPRCRSCPKCKSDLAQDPEKHNEPEPHQYIKRYNSSTGEPYEICMTCLGRREDLEKPYEEPQDTRPPNPDPNYPKLGQYPHCDMFVLHVPGSCEYCDLEKNKPLHDYRKANNINYTGENDPTKHQCPAEKARPRVTIERWGGNVAKAPKVCTREVPKGFRCRRDEHPEGTPCALEIDPNGGTWERRFDHHSPHIPERCKGCGEPLLLESLFVDDGCPCNTPRGVNFKPKECAVCRTDNCVKPGHRIFELFGNTVQAK